MPPNQSILSGNGQIPDFKTEEGEPTFSLGDMPFDDADLDELDETDFANLMDGIGWEFAPNGNIDALKGEDTAAGDQQILQTQFFLPDTVFNDTSGGQSQVQLTSSQAESTLSRLRWIVSIGSNHRTRLDNPKLAEVISDFWVKGANLLAHFDANPPSENPSLLERLTATSQILSRYCKHGDNVLRTGSGTHDPHTIAICALVQSLSETGQDPCGHRQSSGISMLDLQVALGKDLRQKASW